MPGLTDPTAETALSAAGLQIRGDVDDATLPSPERVWRVTVGVQEPTSRIPFGGAELSREVDAEWTRLARSNGIVDAEGGFLIALGRKQPWTEVRLTGRTALAAHLTGPQERAGHAEFVTMARDGSAMCGVTSEEHDVWLVVDADLIHARPRPRPVVDPADVDLSSLGPLQVDDLFAPDRRNPAFQGGWVLLGFHRNARYLARLHEIPAEVARSVGLPAGPGPDAGAVLDEDAARAIGTALGVPVDTQRLICTLEYQTTEEREAQSRERKLPR